ncbi:MAG: B12-binding domain-containing radical SAM protein [Dehalococcoidales bacterium]|nr:B12-binding domain-containing radical SAM protein [Dehalococcoidales bacterium]MDP7525133.1 B12-binding domain-containing radical SAM protein [Dehalococcoidales bacterium]
MKILLVYPRYPETFWSFSHALKFISKKASFPPLGLLTVAAMLPQSWEKKLVDMNVTTLNDKDIEWADYVFISAMVVQKISVREVVARCNELGVKTVAGGPLFTTGYEEFEGIDHFVLGEAEVTLPLFLRDLAGDSLQHIYASDKRPAIDKTPVPLWPLIKMKNYSSMNFQYSRGCPFDCDFCDIIILNGHNPRTKTREQIGAEMDALYNQGWRGGVFVVDDNFIGNKKKLRTETLPTLIEWSKRKKYPFAFFTEASINLADDEELMGSMSQAGFDRVFIGIETPSEDGLAECNKQQNKGRDLAASVKKIQNHGFEVQGGFIVGFDSDPATIFRSQINFIQNSGIVTAMVGLLNAPNGTKLYQRLKKEGRLTTSFTGNNTDININFVPKMKYETLIEGYTGILETIYSPRQYYERVRTFLHEYRPPRLNKPLTLQRWQLEGFVKSVWFLGIKEKGRRYYWKLMISSLFKHPRAFPLSVSLAVFGFHFRKVAEKLVNTKVGDSPALG